MSQIDSKDLTTAELHRIDVVCDDFETKWKAGELPDLTVYAARFDEKLRVAGLTDLVVLDAFYRNAKQSVTDSPDSTLSNDPEAMRNQSHGLQTMAWQDYVKLFPILANVPVPAEFRAGSGESAIGDRFQRVRLFRTGGLGRVSIAQDQQFGRNVAIKEMRRKYADQLSFRDRFVREAEITGRLEHPSIVPVYARGEHENGQPYYVMRLIQGRSLLAAIEETATHDRGPKASGLSLSKRKLLQRFIDVCQAVEYAHNHGVIHRDIKPENIMLGEYGETLLVDWGLAKEIGRRTREDATGSTTGDADGQTRVGAVLGTPAYMSPEQSVGDLENVDQKSDIYCLGATLFHLLTGDSPKPVHLIPGKEADTSPANRHGHETGDVLEPLMAICFKAMELNPGDRYQTANQLASDIEMALADQPVSVYADPMTVRFRRWIDRNRAIAGASLAAAAVAFIGLITFSWMSGRHARELEIKNQQMSKLVQRETRLRTEAEQSEKRTINAMAYLVNAMRSPDPNRSGREIKVVDILDQAVFQLDQDFANDPLMHAQMLSAIGQTYAGLGEFKLARPLVEKAYSIYLNQQGIENRLTLKTGNQLATIYQKLDEPQASQLLGLVLNTSRKALGEEDPDTLAFRQSAAVISMESGQAEQAVQELETLLPAFERLYGAASTEYLTLMNDLANAYYIEGRVRDAVEISREVYERRLGEKGPDALVTIIDGSNYAAHLMKTTNRQLAGAMLEQLLSSARENLGDDHFQTLVLIGRLGSFYVSNNDLRQGLPLLRESLDRSRKIYGERHSRTLVAANELGRAYIDSGEYEKAALQFTAVYEASIQQRGPEHPETLTVANNLASAYRAVGRYDKAIELFKQTLTAQTNRQGADHPNTIRSLLNLAGTMQLASQDADSIPVCRQAYQTASQRFGKDNSQAQTAQSLEAMAHLKLGDYEQARTILEASLDVRSRTIPDHWLRYNTMSLLGEAYLGLEQPDKAGPLLIESYEKMLEQKSKMPVRVRIRLEQAKQRMIKFFESQGMPDTANAYRDAIIDD